MDTFVELTTIPQSYTLYVYTYYLTEEGKENWYAYNEYSFYLPYTVADAIAYLPDYNPDIYDFTVNGKRAELSDNLDSDTYVIMYEKTAGLGPIELTADVDGVQTKYSFDGPVVFDYFRKLALGEKYEDYYWSSIEFISFEHVLTESDTYVAELITYYTNTLVINEQGSFERKVDGLLTQPTVADILEILEIDPSEYYVFLSEYSTYDYLITYYELSASYYTVTAIKKSLVTAPFTVTYSYRESDDGELITNVFHYDDIEMMLQPVTLHSILYSNGVTPYEWKIAVDGEVVCDLGVKSDYPIMWFFEDVEIVATPLYRYHIQIDDADVDVGMDGYVYDERLTPLELAEILGINAEDYLWHADGMMLSPDMMGEKYPYSEGGWRSFTFDIQKRRVKVRLEVCDNNGYMQVYYEIEETGDILFSKLIEGYVFDDYVWKASRWDGEYGYENYWDDIDLSSGEYLFTIDKSSERAVTHYIVTAYSREFSVNVSINAKPPFYDDYRNKTYTFKEETPILEYIRSVCINYTQYRWYITNDGYREIDVETYVATEMVDIVGEFKDSWIHFQFNGLDTAHYFDEGTTMTLAELIGGYVGLSFDDYLVWTVNGDQVYRTDITLYSGDKVVATNDYAVKVYFESYGGYESGFDIEDWSEENRIRTYQRDSEWTTPNLIAHSTSGLMEFVGWGYRDTNSEGEDEFIIIDSIDALYALKMTEVFLQVVSRVDESKLYGCYFDSCNAYAFDEDGLWVIGGDLYSEPMHYTEYEIFVMGDSVEVYYSMGVAHLYEGIRVNEVRYMLAYDDSTYMESSIEEIEIRLQYDYVIESIMDIYGNRYQSLDELTDEPTVYLVRIRYVF